MGGPYGELGGGGPLWGGPPFFFFGAPYGGPGQILGYPGGSVLGKVLGGFPPKVWGRFLFGRYGLKEPWEKG